ncbi:VPH2 [Candida margitis]|uniref:VPH2 n=1 Tax=Candida margitis TaxID=1775924 RepID=UPI0022272F58|nr:VPH2 [Candida margitis]KAI5967579.1 VPH2 [Candida margitis]
MTLFELTNSLKRTITESSYGQSEKHKLLQSEYVSHRELVQFYQACNPTPTLLSLIRQTKLHLPKYKTYKQTKTKEFLKMMEKLRLEAQEAEYRKLINPDPEHTTLYDTSNQEYVSPVQAHKELKNQLTTIVNVFISVGSVSYAVWYWTASSWGLRDSYRVLLTVFFGLLVLVAEVVVYMGYLNKIEEARAKESKKKEVKKVIKTYDLTLDNLTAEKL